MLDLIFWIAVFALSLFVLVKSSDSFTESAEKIGTYFGLSPFIIGVTLVAIGTSLPELISSIFAVLKNSSEIVIGNVVGSNITNIFLILGIAAVLGRKIRVTYESLHVDLTILVGSSFLLAITVWDGIFSFSEALLFIACAIIYLYYTLNSKKEYDDREMKEVMKYEFKHKRRGRILFILLASVFFIYLGAMYTVEAVIKLSELLNIGKEVIAISAVALGTSLPELSVTVSAARKGKPEIAVGNIIGSNIFNTFVVMGMPALLGNLIIPQSVLVFGLPVMLMATLFCVFTMLDKEINRWEGWLMIMFYILFIGELYAFI